MKEGLDSFFPEFNSSYQCVNESALAIWLLGYNLGLGHFTLNNCQCGPVYMANNTYHKLWVCWPFFGILLQA